jgi:hypothetical protein
MYTPPKKRGISAPRNILYIFTGDSMLINTSRRGIITNKEQSDSLAFKIKNLFKPIEENSDGFHTFNELYDHRIALFIALLHKSKKNAWKSQRNSAETIMKGWFIAGIDDKITYHLPNKYWKHLKVRVIKKGKWDGHNSKDVLKRLLKL